MEAEQAEPPVRLKPFAKALKALAARQVDLEKLYALNAASQRWHDLAAGPLKEEILEPVKQKARQLSSQVQELSGQKQELEQIRSRREAQLVRLGRALKKARRFHSNTLSGLEQAQLLLGQQNQLLRRYRRGVKQAKHEHLAIKDLLQQERLTSQHLHNQLHHTRTDLTQRLQSATSLYEGPPGQHHGSLREKTE